MRPPRATSLKKRRTQMQTLTRRHIVVIEDYDILKTMNENVKHMKLTHLMLIFL